MLAYAYLKSNGHVPRSRAPLYKEAVDGLLSLSEQKGNITSKEVIKFDSYHYSQSGC